jgi:magnesium-transporting ATPase (P-type)
LLTTLELVHQSVELIFTGNCSLQLTQVIVIANVPEGLPATVTSCLTISARRLAQRQVFVKRLDVIETLGCVVIDSS